MDFLSATTYIREFVQCGLEPSNCRLVDGMEAFSNGLSSSPSVHVCIVGFESHLKRDFQNEIDSIGDIVHRLNIKGGCNVVIQSDSNSKRKEKSERNDAVGNWYYSFLSAPYVRDEF